MKIAFVTTSLDPGRDGVGDYTRRLAQACIELGHEACLLSLNESPGAERACPGNGISVLRMNSNRPWPQRLADGRAFIESERPDWVSLQFVCYGYSPNGICMNLAQRFTRLTSGFRVHIMFHELWIGYWPGATLKERIVGAAQKHCIVRMLNHLRPAAIHTSIPSYVTLLDEAGFRAGILPLFGNIPIAQNPSERSLFGEFHRVGIEISPRNRKDFLIAGIFGSIHPNWPPEPLLAQLSNVSAKRPVIASIGRIGPGRELWNKLSESYAGRIDFVALGERAPEQVSEFLQTIDVGIATSPYDVIGKSGTVAAMIEHGCPVIVNWHERQNTVTSDPLIHLLTPDIDVSTLRRQEPRSHHGEIANEFVELLSREREFAQMLSVGH